MSYSYLQIFNNNVLLLPPHLRIMLLSLPKTTLEYMIIIFSVKENLCPNQNFNNSFSQLCQLRTRASHYNSLPDGHKTLLKAICISAVKVLLDGPLLQYFQIYVYTVNIPVPKKIFKLTLTIMRTFTLPQN